MKKQMAEPGTWTDLSAADVMKSPVIAVNEAALLGEVAQALSDERIGGALVNDHRGVPVGVVSLLDIAAALAGMNRAVDEPGGFYRTGRLLPEAVGDDPETQEEGAAESVTVSEIMSPHILSVPASATLDRVAKMLHDRQVHRVFVHDAKGAVVGVVSTMDILRALTRKPKE